MDKAEVFAKVKSVIVEQLGCAEDAVKEDTVLVDDLKADSLDMVEMIMNLEESFDISIVEGDEENLDKLKTVADIVTYIMQQA